MKSRQWPSCLLSILSLLSYVFHAASALSFTTSTPTQCDNFQVDWTGGIAPFQLLLTPLFGSPKNMSIPDSAFSNGKGSYSFQLALNATVPQQFLVTMSDSTGFSNGITSDILTVGKPLGGTCNVTDPGVDFFFETNDALQQCRVYTFSNYVGASQPVTIFGLIPLGDIFEIQPPSGPTSYDWTDDVATGTSIVFIMMDSKGKTGGSTSLNIVGSSDDLSCLNGSSPSSTASPSATASTTSAPSSGGKPSIAAMAGIVIGSLLFFAVVVTLGLFFLKGWRDRKNGVSPSSRQSRRYHPDVDLDSEGRTPFAAHSSVGFLPNHSGANLRTSEDYALPPGHEPDPFCAPPVPPPNPDDESSFSNVDYNPFAEQRQSSSTYSSDNMSSARHRSKKRSMAMSNAGLQPSRFILHTDIEDEEPQPNEHGVVELPPQYSERRGVNNTTASNTPSTYSDAFNHS